MLLAGCQMAAAQALIPRPDINKFCVMDTTGGYTSIEDTLLWNPVCNYETLTAAHLNGAQLDRGKFSFFPNKMSVAYLHSGYAQGHCLPFDDFCYAAVPAKASMNLKRNLAPQPQNQNIGTKLACENVCRALAKEYGSVKVYSGTVGSLGRMGNINIPEAYWTVIITPNEWRCYYMPTTGDHIHYADLEQYCRIDYQNLVQQIKIDPLKLIK